MKIHILRQRATEKEIQEMLEELQNYIKSAVDVERNILAGGGEYHADCEEALLEDGSCQENIWGVDWGHMGSPIKSHPLKGTCQEKKVFRKQKEAFFLRRRCGCENGPFYSSSEKPPPYRLFCSRSNLLPTLHGSLRFSLTERSSL